ncbi:MAG: hypothetical protein IKO72_05325 [Kiritimatiellae bacterium]|nr:hypothetical protein [Kiritimatiellia bacterium]
MLSDRINGSGMRQRLSSGDWSAATLVAGAVILCLTLWPYPLPHPCVWQDLAVAAGLRQPTMEFPSLAAFISRILFDRLGADSGFAAMVVGGHLLSGVTAGLWYFVFRQLLEFCGRLDMSDSMWNKKICPALSAAGALLFAFSEPVWTSSQTFTAAGLDLFLAAGSMSVLLRFIARGRRQMGVLAFLGLGALAAETPFGLLPLAAAAGLLILGWRMIDAHDDIEPVIRLPPIEEFPWMLVAFAWVVGAGITLAIADSSFRAAGGDPGSFEAAARGWFNLLREGTTPAGAGVGLAVSALPLAFAMFALPWLSFPECRKPVWLRLACLLAGIVAVVQLLDMPELRYRTWTQEDEAVATALLPGLLMAMAAAAAVLCAASFAAMAWCHETRIPSPLVVLGRILIVLAAVAAVASAGYGRQCRDTRAKLAKVAEHVGRTLDECKGRDEIPSHGRLDVILELRARCQGRNLKIVKDGQ